MAKVARQISYTTDGGPRWAFVIVEKKDEKTFDDHKGDDKLDVCRKKSGELSVKFNGEAIGQIVHEQDREYTDDEIAELCGEHGIVTGVDASELQDSDDADKNDVTPHQETGESNDGPQDGPG